eukprot:gene15169-62354_t
MIDDMEDVLPDRLREALDTLVFNLDRPQPRQRQHAFRRVALIPRTPLTRAPAAASAAVSRARWDYTAEPEGRNVTLLAGNRADFLGGAERAPARAVSSWMTGEVVNFAARIAEHKGVVDL